MIKTQKQHLRSYLLHCGHGLLIWYLIASLPIFQLLIGPFYSTLPISFISAFFLGAIGYAIQLIFEWCVDQ
jgi:hypothetical protein